jgi:serine beta-lactamase-like protein LACTB
VGSRHNRGCAVDLTLCELANGNQVEMPSGYDEFTVRAYPNWPGGTARQRWHRDLLRRAMERAGFAVYEYEWWHFDARDWQLYPVLDESLK